MGTRSICVAKVARSDAPIIQFHECGIVTRIWRARFFSPRIPAPFTSHEENFEALSLSDIGPFVRGALIKWSSALHCSDGLCRVATCYSPKPALYIRLLSALVSACSSRATTAHAWAPNFPLVRTNEYFDVQKNIQSAKSKSDVIRQVVNCR